MGETAFVFSSGEGETIVGFYYNIRVTATKNKPQQYRMPKV